MNASQPLTALGLLSKKYAPENKCRSDRLTREFALLALEWDRQQLEDELQRHLREMVEWSAQAIFTFDEDSDKTARLRERINELDREIKVIQDST
jgi:hypothetical protein